MEEKVEDPKKGLRKNLKKALDVLERISSDCQIPFDEKFSVLKSLSADEMTISQIQHATHEMKKEITRLMKAHFLQGWLETIHKTYEGSDLNNMVGSLQVMIEMEPVHSYDYFSKLFSVLKNLSSEDESVVMNTLFMIRENSSTLSTEEIINSYGELVRSKYKEPVVYAILDGTKKSKNKKNTEYIASYFNEKHQPGNF